MGLYNFLIIDLNPHSCPANTCGQLPDLVRDSIPAVEIDVQRSTLFPPRVKPSQPDLIFLRPSPPKILPDVLHKLREKSDRCPILGIFCIGWGRPGDVSEAVHKGLDDFLTCPYKKVDLFPRIRRLLELSQKPTAATQAVKIRSQFRLEALVGESKHFVQTIGKIPLLARSDATVLITGETGTGKELVARAVHYRSARNGRPFIPVNCGALPDNLFENELFGHIKGAFTDASSEQRGLVGEAEGGTMLLDEVDILSASAQVKLLRFLQDGEYRPLGSPKNVIADVRIVAATNVDLWHQVQAKHFREDLFYRLNVLPIHLAPLRERIEDIPLLAAHFLARYASQYGRGSLRLSPGALQKLLAYPWPGNVRELEAVTERAVILTSTSVLQPENIDLIDLAKSKVSEIGSFRDAKAQTIEQFERSYLTNLLSAHRGNITWAAKQAGKDRRGFQRLLRKYSLECTVFQKLI